MKISSGTAVSYTLFGFSGIIIGILLFFVIVFSIAIVNLTYPVIPFSIGGYDCSYDKKVDEQRLNDCSIIMNKSIPFFENMPNAFYSPANTLFLACLAEHINQSKCSVSSLNKSSRLLETLEGPMDIQISQTFPFLTKITALEMYWNEDKSILFIFLLSTKYLSIAIRMLQTDLKKVKRWDDTKVYKGAYEFYTEIAKEFFWEFEESSFNEMLKEKANQTKIVVFGHSVAGILSNFMALDLQQKFNLSSDQVYVYTFGSLRPGDWDFKLFYEKNISNTYRIINDQEIFQASPVSFTNKRYRHVGTAVHLDFDGSSFDSHSIRDYTEALIKIQK